MRYSLKIMRRAKIIYKIVEAADWQRALAAGFYDGSRDDRRDGFIHLSCGTQLPGTLHRHFAGRTDLVLVAFRTADCGAALKWETSRGGDLFPHHYGRLDPALALWTRPLGDGVPHVLPPLEPET